MKREIEQKVSQLFYQKLYRWYELNKRILPWRETEDAYKIWVSEIILQQTRVIQGIAYYMRFIERFPNVESLAEANEDEVLLYWQGLGYYSRARNMHKGARYIGNTANFPKTIEGLRQIAGVGDYTAGAIASFAYNIPYPALDGNVYRVLARLEDCDLAFDTTEGKKHFHKVAERLLDKDNPRLFNSSIMEFGALFCIPKSPECERCPLQTFCKSFAKGTVELLPVRKPKVKPRERWFNYTIYLSLQKGEIHTLIRQRTEDDIWKHLWEFPLHESDQLEDGKAIHFDIIHILSHQRLHTRFNIKETDELPHIENCIEIKAEELQDYALSRLTLKALEKLNPILTK